MCRMALCFIVVVALGRLAGAADKITVPNCYVVVAEVADLPPREAGVVLTMSVAEGQEVKEGQALMQLDAGKAQAELEVAKAKYVSALTKAKDDVNIRFAIASADVTQAELEVNLAANRKVAGAIPEVHLNELRLQCTKAKLGIEESKLAKSVAESDAKVAEAEVAAAQVMVERHQLFSPIDGVVVDVRAHKGEAVQPTQAVVRVVNLKTLWVQGDVSADKYARSQFDGCEADVMVPGAREPLKGKVIFVNPLTDPGNTFKVRVKIDNERLPKGWLVHPGMRAEMNIQLAP